MAAVVLSAVVVVVVVLVDVDVVDSVIVTTPGPTAGDELQPETIAERNSSSVRLVRMATG